MDDCSLARDRERWNATTIFLGQLLNELDTVSEGSIDPGGIREKDVVRGVEQTVSRRPKLRPMLSAIIDSIPRTSASHADLAAPNRELESDAQLTTLPFHDRVAPIGADRPVVLPRRSGRVLTRSVRSTPLSDPLVRPRVLTHTERAPEQPEPGSHASSAKPTTTAHPVGQPPETEGAHDQAGSDLGTRGEGSARPPRPSELPVVERAIQSLQHVSRLVEMQGADPLLGKVRRVLGSRGGTREQEGLTDAELNKYLIYDQNGKGYWQGKRQYSRSHNA